MKMVENLPRRQASLLIQLRTEHVPLQKYLYRIQKAESPLCPHCGVTRETVHHYLLECPKYNAQRARLESEIGTAARSLKSLLNSPNTLKALFRYIHDTGRFKSTYGDLALDNADQTRGEERRKRGSRG